MFEAVEGLVAEHAELEGRLAEPETHADQRLAKRLNQRYAQLRHPGWLQAAPGGSAAATRRGGERSGSAATGVVGGSDS